jgi:Ca2+-binding RTX toxin-like protein
LWPTHNIGDLRKFIELSPVEIRRIDDFLQETFPATWSISQDANTNWTTAINWRPAGRDPLAIDLDGDGIETVGIGSNPVLFDHDANGVKTGTGWVKADDAWLVMDRDGNGSIDTGRELFGVDTQITTTQTVTLPDGSTQQVTTTRMAGTGFEALASLDADANGVADGVFNSADVAYGQVRLWQDLNQDGISQAGELFTLAGKGIASIGLTPSTTTTNLGNGNSITGTATVTRTDGSTTAVDSVGVNTDGAGNLTLASNPFYREFTDTIPLTSTALALPEMGGSGWVRDLREAMSLGTAQSASLVAAAQQFSSGTTRTAQMASLDALISAWANTSGQPKSVDATDAFLTSYPGPGVVQQTNVPTAASEFAVGAPALYQAINALEQFNARLALATWMVPTIASYPVYDEHHNLIGHGQYIAGYHVIIPPAQADALMQAYDSLRSSVYGALSVQTRLKPYLDTIDISIDATGLHFDTAGLATKLTALHDTDVKTAIEDLVDLVRYTEGTLHAVGFNGLAMLRPWVDALPADSSIRAGLTAMDVWLEATPSGTSRADLYLGDGSNNSFSSLDADDLLYGDAGDDVLSGGNGSDTLLGGAGNDTLYGMNQYSFTYVGNRGAGFSDTFDGGAGNDYFQDDEITDGDVYRLTLGGGQDEVRDGGGAGDRIEIGAGIATSDVTVRNYDGSLRVTLASGEQLNVGNSFDRNTGAIGGGMIEEIRLADGTVWDVAAIKQQASVGSAGADQLYGFDSNDSLVGAGGNDTLNGLSGNDVLDAGDGNDELRGGDGSDTLLGGAGDDTLYGMSQYSYTYLGNRGAGFSDTFDGGAGNDYLQDDEITDGDVYRLNLGGGQDTVDDRGGSGDRIEVGAGIASTQVQLTKNSSSLVVTVLGSGESLSVGNFFNGNAAASGAIEEVRFADGTVWDQATLIARATSVAPVVANPIADKTTAEDAAFTYVLPANAFTDADAGQVLAYAATLQDGSTLPSWLAFNAATRTFSGTPVNANVGSLQIKVTATDPMGLSASDVFGLTVTNTNDAPTVGAPVAAQAATQGQAFSLTVPAGTFADVDVGDTLTYSLTQADGTALPAWLSFNASTRLLTGTPANGDVGTTGLKLTATDAAGAAASTSFNLVVANVNDAPVLSAALADQAGQSGTAFSYTVPAGAFTDIDVGDTLTYSARLADGSALPAWLSFNASTRSFTGTPSAAGTTSVRVTATDAGGLATSDVFDLVVTSADKNLTGTAGADTLTGGIGNDTLSGLAGNDSLTGAAGNDLLDGGAGNDTMVGGTGNDTYVVDSTTDVVTEAAGEGTDTVQSSITLTLAANVENLVLTGTAAINGTGNALANSLTGNSANNTLDGGTGADTMAGGAGNDSYVVDNAADVITELVGEGTDSVSRSVTYTLAANVENLTLTGTTAINGTGNASDNVLTGNSANNTLTGGAGNDTLDGGTGNDTMVGGTGDDTYVVNVATDVVTENASEGIDTVQSSVTLTLAANVENLVLTGTTAINGTGNTLDNVLTGNSAANTLTGAAGNDTLDGGAGTDSLVGGAGNDTYVVDVTTDVVTEAANEGTDTVRSAVTWTLGANFENLVLTGTAAINGTGNTLANSLTGNSANNTLDGGTGADTMAGGAGNDSYVVDNAADVITELAAEGTDGVSSSVTYTLAANVENLTLTGTTAINGTGNASDNVLTGNSANNTLTGGAGNDTIDGGTGNDTMVGGAGNDVYVVNVATDVVTELANEGTDTVQSAVTWTLGSNLENLTLTGTTAINGTGNTLDNWLIGNSANNSLTGAAGNDTLDGGTGNDTMLGGAGNDVYYVNVSTDVVTENAAEGTDTVNSAVTWTLGSNLENLTLTGTTAINGTGNTLDNWLIGNGAANSLTGLAGNDTLDGGAGTDTLVGGAGNDVYFVDVSTDVVTENAAEGTDTVNSAVTWTLGTNLENLTLTGTTAINGTGNTLDNLLIGNSAANTLTGGTGADTLDGAAGNDTLVGGAGADSYRFGRGWGTDTVQENDATANVKDLVVLQGTVTQADVAFSQAGNNLEMLIGATGDKLVFTNWYLGSQYHAEEFRFTDGSVLTDSQAQGLVGAMAAFSATAADTSSGMTTSQVRIGTVDLATNAVF